MRDFDVIVIGGGHAGVEASFATARMGHSTLLLTLNKKMIAALQALRERMDHPER